MSKQFGLEDIEALEDGCAQDEYYAALQRAINAGTGWRLQGSYGRAMMDAINAGRCMLGPNDTVDYYGNHIPARSQVKEGTKGSRGYVVMHHGAEWAEMLEAA